MAWLTRTDDVLVVGRVLNAVFAGLVPLVVYFSALRADRSNRLMAILAAATVALSYPLFRLSVRALTETVFIVLALIVLILLERQLNRPRFRLLIGAAALCGLLVLVRYVGIAILVPLIVVAWRSYDAWRRRIALVILVTAVAVAPVAAYNLNAEKQAWSSHLSSTEDGSGLRLDVMRSAREAGLAVVGPNSPASHFALVGMGIVALFTPLLAVTLLTRRECIVCQQNGGSRVGLLRPLQSVLDSTGTSVWLLFWMSYVALIVFERWSIHREIIARYWLPVVVIGIIILARCCTEFGYSRQFVAPFLMLVLLFVAVQAARLVWVTWLLRRSGIL
jgi:4-amino-4-deoxy-L-arabinose transferase-like glycosyltransferase